MSLAIGSMIGADRVRRNHALEHATISIITERHPTMLLSGRSTTRGFSIYGDVDTNELRSAVDEARARLRGGEAYLAIHPRCGTNLAVAGILSGVAASLAVQLGPRQNRVPYAILASLGALIVAPGIGTGVQRRITTLADLGGLEVVSVTRRRLRLTHGTAHWVSTRVA